MIVHERTLKNVLTPAYHWLFFMIGRLQHGVKFLVDLRTDVLVNMKKVYVTNNLQVIVLQSNSSYKMKIFVKLDFYFH